MNTLHGCPFLRKQFYAWVENNLSHLVLSWWSKETAMMINFVLKFSSQAFLAHKLIDLHKYSHFQLWFHFFRTSFDFKSLCKKYHIFSVHIINASSNLGFEGTWSMNSWRLHAIWNTFMFPTWYTLGPVFLYMIIQQFLLSYSCPIQWHLYDN